jgi:serine beta-lactamase-like protein LACTB
MSFTASAQKVKVFNNTLTKSQKNVMIQEMATILKNKKMPSFVAAATLGDKVIWYQSLGYADMAKKIKVNPNFHMYRWASVSKVATDRLAIAMDEMGVLDLDKPISNYYNTSRPKYLKRCLTPSTLKKYFDCRRDYGSSSVTNIRGACFDVKAFGRQDTGKGYHSWVLDKKSNYGNIIYKTKNGQDKCRIKYSIKAEPLPNNSFITLRHLLKHTSGVQHYSHLGRNAEPPTSKMKDRTAIKNRKSQKKSQMAWAIPYFFPKHPLLTLPGKTRTYTTFGYNLAGRIIEKQSAMRLEDLMDLYAGKIGANSIQSDYLGISSRGNYSRTFTYKRANGKFVKNNYVEDNSYKLAGGGFMSTIVDLAKFCVAMGQKGTITKNGTSSYSHSGSHPGRSNSYLKLYTNKDGVKQCMVVMTNTQHGNLDIVDVQKRLENKLHAMKIWKKK